MGLLQVVTDPRTSVSQPLHAIHLAELADNDGWSMLIDFATQMGQDEMADEFSAALRHEQEHLVLVRSYDEPGRTRGGNGVLIKRRARGRWSLAFET